MRGFHCAHSTISWRRGAKGRYRDCLVLTTRHVHIARVIKRAILRVMGRLNMTLDGDTEKALIRYASKLKIPVAAVARTMLLEGLANRERLERQRKLARDYAAGRDDVAELIELSDVQLAWND
jgi:hypothetical protein